MRDMQRRRPYSHQWRNDGTLSEPKELTTILDWALYYHSLGFSVIPLTKHSKLPAIEWKKYQKERASEEQLRKWFEGKDLNIGLVMGAVSNAFAVDIDGGNAARRMELKLVEMGWSNLRTCLINTYMTKTGGGGFHFVLKPDAGLSVPSRAIWSDDEAHSEIRLLGGVRCVVAGPSVHPSGLPYIWNGKEHSLITRKEMERFIELVGTSTKQITLDAATQTQKTTHYRISTESGSMALTPEQMQGLLVEWEPRYKQGSRNEIVLGLSGVFLKEGFTLESAERFIRLLCTKTHDEELASRLITLRVTYNKDPSEVAGWSILDGFED